MASLVHTLEWIRFGEICRPVLVNTLAYSNNEGLIHFPNFRVDRGPEGTYLFDYSVSSSVFSDIEEVSILSQVASLSVNTVPPLVVTIGTEFSPQP